MPCPNAGATVIPGATVTPFLDVCVRVQICYIMHIICMRAVMSVYLRVFT